MTTKWYYQTMGAQVGPLTSGEFLGKVRAGEVTANTLVRKGDSQWVEAADVGGLFEEAVKPIVTKYCPYCDAQIREKPPCVCPSCERLLHRLYHRKEFPKVVVPERREHEGEHPSDQMPSPPVNDNGAAETDEEAPSRLIQLLRRAFRS